MDHILELCKLQADLNLGDYDQRRPLHLAACENELAIAKLLLKYNAHLNVQDNYGVTPLWSALKAGNYRVAQYLHEKGATIGESPKRNRMLAQKLSYFVFHNKLKDLQEWLACGVSPNVTDYDNRTPLHVAQSCNNQAAVEILTKAGANRDLADRWGAKAGNSTPKSKNSVIAEAIEKQESGGVNK
eukprot:UN23964